MSTQLPEIRALLQTIRDEGLALRPGLAIRTHPGDFETVARLKDEFPSLPLRANAFLGSSRIRMFDDFLEGAMARLDGAAARGDLIGREAPDLTITWSSDPSLDSLDDLRGRVVVLDFWATWCGPCIGSIPNVRELQERYKDYPVTIVGVTSLQGNHVPKEGKPISTKGDPQKEYDLMRQYMQEQGITWTIAFSEQDVFNPDYGVRGIPFVAILDPQGKVRHAGLHPADPLPAKAGKIDALLKEAGLPAPPPVPSDGEAKAGQ
jgi:thiol-disulfide isomerase/thioredoxin